MDQFSQVGAGEYGPYKPRIWMTGGQWYCGRKEELQLESGRTALRPKETPKAAYSWWRMTDFAAWKRLGWLNGKKYTQSGGEPQGS